MHDDDYPVLSSASQDAWQELCDAVRIQLAAHVAAMPAMDPDELKTLIEAMREAQWLETNAKSFDHDVALRLNRISAPD